MPFFSAINTKCYEAFNYGRQEEALRLLKQVKDPRTVKSKNNFTILHCAAYHGWLDVVKQLINEHHFDPDCKDNDGNTPLSKARGNGKQSVVDYLERANIGILLCCLLTFAAELQYFLCVSLSVLKIIRKLEVLQRSLCTSF